MNKYKLRIAGLFLFALVSGILLGWLFRSVWAGSQVAASAGEEVHEGQREFINPLLECGDAGAAIGRQKSRFEDIVQKKVDETIKSGKAGHISVYYRDLNSGPSFGIGEKEFFSPASLLKVPILIGWLKEAEKNPAILEKEIKYDGDNFNANKNETINAAVEAEYGKTYTAEELLNLMIVYSDNNAVLLLGNSGWSFSGKIYDALRLPKPDFSGGDYQLTVKDYSSFFRILYNASYLNQDMSNKALELLASVDFRRGLSAGVPENIVVAHKFGERTAPEGKQLHDCGIVYYPNRPYLLCVMTKGADFDTLVSVVSGVSRLVFDEVAREQTLQ